jgi:hypothetical protein
VIIVGLVLELAGVAMVWREYSDSRRKLGGAAGFVDSLTKLLAELARHPRSTVLFTFGTLLVFLGGLIAGVGGL